MGRFDALTTLEEKKDQTTDLQVNQQTSKPTKKQTSLPASGYTNKPTNQQTNKEANQQTSTQSLSTKEKVKYSTYLREDSILSIQVQGAQTKKNDHEVSQEAVDYYFKDRPH